MRILSKLMIHKVNKHMLKKFNKGVIWLFINTLSAIPISDVLNIPFTNYFGLMNYLVLVALTFAFVFQFY
jgi:hypothetical protein